MVRACPAPLTLPQLGFGAGFALWGFRACAAGRGGCAALIRGYQNTLGHDGLAALDALLTLAQTLGFGGRRKVSLGAPGLLHPTHDEMTLVAALAAAQSGEPAGRDAALRWLFAGEPPLEAAIAADALGAVFTCHGLEIETPELQLGPPPKAADFPVHIHAAGRA